MDVGGAPARVTELPFLSRRFSDAEEAAQATAKGPKGPADTIMAGCGAAALKRPLHCGMRATDACTSDDKQYGSGRESNDGCGGAVGRHKEQRTQQQPERLTALEPCRSGWPHGKLSSKPNPNAAWQ